ncbi:MAG: hypothetical protein EA380_00955 [Phycisphaeraceae bacterium]|nr:MAG: hypothetical protein EA380_00955 [Phycisphaeraceae bacterium]
MNNSDAETTGNEAEREREAEAIAQESPEGRPANPEMRKGSMVGVMITIFAAVFVLGVVFLAMGRVLTGVVIMGLGVLFVILNPAIWAGFVRAKEREKINGG